MPTNIVMGGRRSGKTTILVRWMVDAPPGTTRVCVAANKTQARLVRDIMIAMGGDPESWQFITDRELERVRGRGFVSNPRIELGVDQIDYCDEDAIRKTGYPIGLVTMTYPEPDYR